MSADPEYGIDLDDNLSDLDPPSDGIVPLMWSDAAVKAIWSMVYRRDDEITKLRTELVAVRTKLIMANAAVYELQQMVGRAHTGEQ